MALTPITDMVTRAQSRVLAQYAGAPKLMAWVGALGRAVQTAETAVFGLLRQLDFNTATGVWLDRLGALLDEARESLDDDQYKAFIRARILANRSNGSIEAIYGVARTAWAGATLLGTTIMVTYAITDIPPAAMQMILSGPTPDSIAQRLARVLARARASGVRLSMVYCTAGDMGSFTFASDVANEPSSTQGFGDISNPYTGGVLASTLNT